MGSPLLKRAFDRATAWHAGQHRKYPGTKVPYASHIAAVACTVARHGFDEEVVAAAALHDTLEDTEATYDDLVQGFGARVADLVRDCSEPDKTLSWEARKAQYLAHFPAKPWAAQAITLADKIDNLQSLVVCADMHGNPWEQLKRGRATQLARFVALQRAAQSLPAHPLIDEYVQAVEAATRVDEHGVISEP